MNKRQAKKNKCNRKLLKTIDSICKRINKALAEERAQKALGKLEEQK